jgi:N-acetylated-alpha-linked acidic dipeptidase
VRKSAAAYETRYHHSLEKTSTAAADRLTAANELLFRTERAMLLPAGLPGRDWFKHQIYAPGLYTGYGAKTLPGIREAAEAGRWEEANREAEALVGVLAAVKAQIDQADKALGRL